MSTKLKNIRKSGFTLIELMIATTIFALLLLICMNTLVQITRAYYKGFTTTKTQEAARTIIDEVTQGIQLSSDNIMPSVGPSGPQVAAGSDASGIFCIGYKSYTYAIGRKVSNSPSSNQQDKEIRNGLVRQELNSSCNATTPKADLNVGVTGTAKSLLPENMRLTKMRVSPINADATLWNVSVSVIYGDTDLVVVDPANSSRVICAQGTGAEFCAISEISTTVKRRFGGN